jgi:hypothetical protein
MVSTQLAQRSLSLNQEQVLAIVRTFINGGTENDQPGFQPGPWDSTIRAAAYIRLVFQSLARKHPEIFDVIGGGQNPGEAVALNPQPLPPRYAFLTAVAQAVVHRAELLQEITATAAEGESSRSIIIVGGYVSRFADDWCGNGFHIRWPFPGPPPPWFTEELTGVDLVVLATHFDQAAKESYDRDLAGHFQNASSKFAESGLARLRDSLAEPVQTT